MAKMTEAQWKAEQAFVTWKSAVDATIVRKIGLHADDLPDYPYRDAYENRVPPSRAAARAIAAAKKDMGL